MRIFASCMSCQEELGHPTFEPFFAPYYDDRIAPITCFRGHKSVLMLQSQKFEVLLESGADALNAGFTLEAAATFSAALERFIEFAMKVMLVHKGMSMGTYEQMFKEMARQSERQTGSFMAMHALVFGAPYVPNKAIAPFRNSVIHKGEIPTPEEARAFCANVYTEIYRTASLLQEYCKYSIMSVVTEDLKIRQGKLPKGTKVSTAETMGVYSLSAAENKQEFEEAYQTYTAGKELLSRSAPELRALHESLFPRPPDA